MNRVETFPYPSEATLQDREAIILQLVREQLLVYVHQEIPYQTQCALKALREDASMIRIAVAVIVSRKSHRGIIIGARGQTARRIAGSMEKRLTDLFGKPVAFSIMVRNEKTRA